MIDIQRYLLIAAIAALSFMLLVEWKNFDGGNTAPLAAAAALAEQPANADVLYPPTTLAVTIYPPPTMSTTALKTSPIRA